MITSTIVTVTATVVEAPAASQLQQSGAAVSLGGTTLSTGTYQYCGTLGAVEALLGSGGNHAELLNMATTFFTQGNAVGLYLLELGVEGSASAGITALQTWITANPNVFFGYLTPATWDSAGAALNTMAANYESPTGKTYFCVTTTSATISAYAPTTKSIVAVCNAPTAPGSEFTAAAFFYNMIVNAPSASAPAPPLGFRYLFGVTPWNPTNNQTTINAILSAYGNIVLTGAEGGISTACVFRGTTMDGNQFMWWWAVDWIQIQAKLQLAAAIINGSNSIPPLYYNQNGINYLLSILTNIGTTGISFGLLLTASFTATSFSTYTTQNPSNYAAGIYDGFSAVVTPQNGFQSIEFSLEATEFAS